MTKHVSVLTFALALAMAAPLAVGAQEGGASAETFARGVAAYEDGDYARAARLWEPLAEEGEPEAQRNLAQLYRLGLGVEKNNERAYELYAAAAERNSVEAQVNAAFLLLTGEGVEKDSKQAALWFARAADQGDALAQFNLGLMYEKGVGVPQNRETARELYRLAANQGQERALARLDAIEGDLPPDGGEAARRERAQAAEERAATAEATAQTKERERRDAEVARVRERAQERAEAEEREEDSESSRLEKADAEAKTGPILMIERIEEPKAEETPQKDAELTDTPDPAAIAALENAQAAFSASRSEPAPQDAPQVAPLAPRKPRQVETVPMAPATPVVPMARMPVVPPAVTMPAPRHVESARMRQVRQAEDAYRRGDFQSSARMLMPLARDGMPVAQFLLGRMFNRGEGVELDHFEAYNLWRSAAANGSERAATALANFSSRFAPSELARAEANYQALQQWLARNGNGR